jgi:hypothetical protein
VRDLGGCRHNNHWRICLNLCEWRGRLPSVLCADGSARLAIPTHSLSGFFNIRHRDVDTAAIACGVTKAVTSAIETSQSPTAAGVTPWRQLLDASELYPWPQLRRATSPAVKAGEGRRSGHRNIAMTSCLRRPRATHCVQGCG